MNKFKVGDKIICIGDQWSREGSGTIPRNKLYTVSEYNEKQYLLTLRLEEYSGKDCWDFNEDEFILAGPEHINYINFPDKLEEIIND